MMSAELVRCEHGMAPEGVSPVAAAFVRLHVDLIAADFPDTWEATVAHSHGMDATLLAKGIYDAIDLDEDDIGFETLRQAHEYLALAMSAKRRTMGPQDGLYVLAATSASLVGEVLAERFLALGAPRRADRLHPINVLNAAYRFVHAKSDD